MAAVGDVGGRDWRAWWLAVRPRTLWAGAAPVAVGTAVAAAEGGARALPALAALAGALLLQVASNFANDVYDFERGADADDRVGPPRATQQGLLSPRQVKTGMVLVFAVSAAVGLYLIAVGGWPILAVGLASALAAWGYTGGPWPFGYHGLGDVAVFVFFGLVAVTGTAYVQTLSLSTGALVASIPIGALATAILAVNNLRDVETDARSGKRTLAVRLGARAARLEYVGLLVVAYASPAIGWLVGVIPGGASLTWLSLPLALPLVRSVWGGPRDEALNAALSGTARLLAAFALLFSVGWCL